MLIDMRNGLMAGGLSAKSYVQDGLVAMWDGIENAGWGVHDADATVWKDLTGNGYDLTLTGVNINANHTTMSVGCTALNDGSISVPYATIEGVMSVTGYNYNQDNMLSTGDATRKRGISMSGYRCVANTSYRGLMRGVYIDGRSGVNLNQPFNFAFSYTADSENNADNCTVYQNGEVPSTLFRATYAWAEDFIDHIAMTASKMAWNLYSLRYYSRALTAAEIAANYAVDKARFNLPDAT